MPRSRGSHANLTPIIPAGVGGTPRFCQEGTEGQRGKGRVSDRPGILINDGEFEDLRFEIFTRLPDTGIRVFFADIGFLAGGLDGVCQDGLAGIGDGWLRCVRTWEGEGEEMGATRKSRA